MRRFDDEDLAGAEFRGCDLSRVRFVGVVMEDAEIDGLVTNLVVNGVEVMAYVEAELDRRYPVRLLIRSDDPADLREGWRQLRDDLGHDRRLVFVHDSWFRRCVLGLSDPFCGHGFGAAACA